MIIIKYVCKYAKQAALGEALGIKGVLRKRRMVYMIGQTRVHLDQVEGLGDFMELEVQNCKYLLTYFPLVQVCL